MENKQIKDVIKKAYSKIATGATSSCCSASSCCPSLQYNSTKPNHSSICNRQEQKDLAKEISSNIGYSKEDLEKVPDGSNLGLGCGNPLAFAQIAKGEIVLDLGSGAGFDCFLAANIVGNNGKVIGIDMTPEMIEKARQYAKENGFENVEFRLGEIENLPISDETIDVIMSNCVINLSPDKERVYKEAFRVLKNGGRIFVADIVLAKELPDFIKNNTSAYIGCIAGALAKDEYLSIIRKAGFADVQILKETIFPIDFIISEDIKCNISKNTHSSIDLTKNIEDLQKSILSILVSAKKL